jgi:hypothetical protein
VKSKEATVGLGQLLLSWLGRVFFISVEGRVSDKIVVSSHEPLLVISVGTGSASGSDESAALTQFGECVSV